MVQDADQPPGFCRDCFAMPKAEDRRCKTCGSPRLVRHRELHDLSIAHIDCDAFYAAVEKRDNPELQDKPVLIGGGKRGVVSTACYVARIRGAKSAMPMFKALQLVPDAIVIRPNMQKYIEVGRKVRELMLQITPAVEPLSIDEAFLDLTGTARLHGQSPAMTLAKLSKRLENEIGISASVGLAPNKYLAKVASDLEKPRGFSVIGRSEAANFLAQKPVSLIWGVGPAMQAKLARDGITHIGQLQHMNRNDLLARYGSMGDRLYFLSRGEDVRRVSADEESKSIGAETTFFEDIAAYSELEAILWPLCEKVARRAKRSALEGRTVTLKLKTSDFKLRSRSVSLTDPTQLAYRIFDTVRPLLQREATGTKFRLIGVSLSNIADESQSEVASLDPRENATTKAELAMDKIREKFGLEAVERGLGTRSKER